MELRKIHKNNHGCWVGLILPSIEGIRACRGLRPPPWHALPSIKEIFSHE